MDIATVRQAFRSVVGDESFRRFVRALNTGRQDRLRFWQEQLWQRFTSAYPAMDLPLASIWSYFRFCEVHGSELEEDVVPIKRGSFRLTADEIKDRDQNFPYARSTVHIEDSFRDDSTETKVIYCPTCRRVLQSRGEWGACVFDGQLPRRWLIGPTTFRQYVDRFLGRLDTVPPKLLARVEERTVSIAAKLQPGDELWEWRREGGPLSSAGGLAIIRDGSVIEWWGTWVS